MVIFLYNLYIFDKYNQYIVYNLYIHCHFFLYILSFFVSIHYDCLANTIFALVPSDVVVYMEFMEMPPIKFNS